MKKQIERRDFLKVASVGILPLAALPSGNASAEEAGSPEQATAAPLSRHGASQIVINQAGPLPITARVEAGSTGPAMLFVSGSVWAQEKEVKIGFEVLLDGTKVGEASIYSNAPSTHRGVVPIYVSIFLNKPWPAPNRLPVYTVTLQPLEGTFSDRNDHFQVMLIA